MRRFIHICLWTLTGIFATASLSAQNPFTYHKGKTYKDVAAYRMEKNIDLNNLYSIYPHNIRTASTGTSGYTFV